MNSVNNFTFLEYKYSNEDHNYLKNTQKRLKQVNDGGLALQILNSGLEAMMSGKPVISSMCKAVDDWWICSSNNNRKGEFSMYSEDVSNFIELLQKQDDFKKAYIFKENDQYNIWIVINETGYEENLKYIKLHREFPKESDFSIILFEEDEEEEIAEQLTYIDKDYKEVKRDG